MKVQVPVSKQQFQQQLVNIWMDVIGEQSHPRSLWATTSGISSLLLTVSVWTITAVTGWYTIGTTADSVSTVWWDSCLLFLGCFAVFKCPLSRLKDRAKCELNCVTSTVIHSKSCHLKSIVRANCCNVQSATELAGTAACNMYDIFQAALLGYASTVTMDIFAKSCKLNNWPAILFASDKLCIHNNVICLLLFHFASYCLISPLKQLCDWPFLLAWKCRT